MDFLKKNKELLLAGLFFILFLAFQDEAVIVWMKHLDQSRSALYMLARKFDPFINFIGNGTTLLVAAGLIFVIGKKFSAGLCYTGKALMLSFFAAGLSVQLLKHLIGRARPRITESLMIIGPSLKGGYDSFPSGHSAVVFCFAFILEQQFPRYRVIFYCIAAIISVMRVVDLSHFPSDIAAGAVLGVIVGKVLSAKVLDLGTPVR
ncbi:MAG TPA: phosphatase PAP2 family protein [Dissulfurispiraceae bacterium]|nr:phosphatase PAP2 family protein [Dissulfurispiraceae bacterium]